MSYKPSLGQMDSRPFLHNAFVKISASWSSNFTNGVAMDPLRILSLTKGQSTSMGLLLSWKTGLDAMCIAA
jgi:hypothetical protein